MVTQAIQLLNVVTVTPCEPQNFDALAHAMPSSRQMQIDSSAEEMQRHIQMS